MLACMVSCALHTFLLQMTERLYFWFSCLSDKAPLVEAAFDELKVKSCSIAQDACSLNRIYIVFLRPFVLW